MLGMYRCISVLRYTIDRLLRSTDINEAIVPKRRAPARVANRSTVSDLLGKLDARMQSGITKAEFKRIFAMCECGLITTRRAFDDHNCQNEVIDLTGDD
jgi:hypothetical protein